MLSITRAKTKGHVRFMSKRPDFTIAQVTEQFDVSRSTVRRGLNNGRFPNATKDTTDAGSSPSMMSSMLDISHGRPGSTRVVMTVVMNLVHRVVMTTVRVVKPCQMPINKRCSLTMVN